MFRVNAKLCALALVPMLIGAEITSPAAAQTPTMAELAQYAGPDRTQRLIDGARKEGTLTVYTSLTVEDINALIAGFEKRYGVKVQLWRASSEKLLQRTVVEARGGRHDVDVIETNGVEVEALARENLLAAVTSPVLAELLPEAKQSPFWVGSRIQITLAAYNPSVIKQEDLPRSYSDLLDPKWKGKLGIEAEDSDWFWAICSELGGEKGLELFREIFAKNGISVRQGHTLLTNLVVSGEVPLALTVYLYKLQQMKAKGAPIELLPLAPVLARLNGLAVYGRSPHPHAALLFFDYLLTDGQDVLASRDFFTTNPRSRKLPDMPIKFVRSAQLLDEGAKWENIWKEAVISRAR